MSSLYSLEGSLNQGHHLADQLVKALRQSQNGYNQTKNRHQAWRAKSQPDNDMSEMFGALLGDTMFAGALSSPLMDLVEGLIDVMHANQENTPRAARQREEKAAQHYEVDAEMEEAYTTLVTQILRAHKEQQEQLQKTQRMLVLTMAAMLKEEHAKKQDHDIAADVLRKPAVARFKQNRHSMDCIRTAFANQAESIAAPRFNAPRYRMTA